MKSRGPGFAPHPGQPLFKIKKDLLFIYLVKRNLKSNSSRDYITCNNAGKKCVNYLSLAILNTLVFSREMTFVSYDVNRKASSWVVRHSV
jgi:hypothetical protein